jgi:predicted SnoaL-like aldol condensation-catalyzing enzyme
MASSRKEAAVEFLSMVVAGDVAGAFDRHIGADFVHHNPHFHGDAAALQAAMTANAMQAPNKVLELQCAIEEGNRVAVFSRIRQEPADRGFAVVHIFRFDGDRIVELWDVGAPVPEQSINAQGMF